jgi:parallel beta-helix repeat protein
MVNCSISFFGQGNAAMTEWISPNNTVNGRPIYHYRNMDMRGTAIPADAGEVIFGNVTNAVVSGRAFSDGSVAIMGSLAPGIRVENCSFSGVRFESIRLIDCPSAYVSRCSAPSGATFLSLSFNCTGARMNNNTLTNSQTPLAVNDNQPGWGYMLVADNLILGDRVGGMLLQGDGNRILRNTINGSSYACIELSNGVGGSIVQNTITGGGGGINLMNVSGLTISQNQISGMMSYGMLTWRLNESTITGNTISDSGRQGIWLEESYGNHLYRNALVDNNGAGPVYNASKAQVTDLGVNTWYEVGSPHGFGNYWSDWTSPDNGTGIVQLPYAIEGGGMDPFPLVAVPPTVPGAVVGLAVNVSGSSGTLSWSAPLNSGSGAVWGYSIYRNGALVASNITLTTYNVELVDGNNVLGVSAFSSAGAGQLLTVQASRSSTPVDLSLLLIIAVVIIGLVAAVLFMRRRK